MTLEQELLNIATRAGIPVIERPAQRDALRWVLSCYRYWTDKDLDQHKSHLAVYAPDFDKGLLTPPSDFRKALVVLVPGIGYAASKQVEEACWDERQQQGSFRKMMGKSEQWWATFEVYDRKGKAKKLGASRARAIMEALG